MNDGRLDLVESVRDMLHFTVPREMRLGDVRQQHLKRFDRNHHAIQPLGLGLNNASDDRALDLSKPANVAMHRRAAWLFQQDRITRASPPRLV